MGAVVGEFVGADRGLGWLLIPANGQADTSLAFAAVLLMAIVGTLLFEPVVLAEEVKHSMAYDGAERADGVALEPPPPGDRYVVIDGVSHAFRRQQLGSLEVLRDVNLTVGRGEFVVLVGPSGCGKSTLLSMVAGLLQGRRRGRSASMASPSMGRAPTWAWSSAAAAAYLAHHARQRPVAGGDAGAAPPRLRGPRERAADPGGPGGVRALPAARAVGRHAAARGARRALIHQPTLLLMDEPFAALDALTREQMALDLQSLGLSRGVAVLFVTHSITEAVLLGNRIVVMSARRATSPVSWSPRWSGPSTWRR